MRYRPGQDRVFIVSEIHPQHGGSLAVAETLILQSKLGGADAIKVQLYDARALWGDDSRLYHQMTREDLAHLKGYAERVGIPLFASAFDLERFGWCEDLDLPFHKIASRSVADRPLCEAALATGKPVYVSLGQYDLSRGRPFEDANAHYLYCVAQYPAMLEQVDMPDFAAGPFIGYSDHTAGISAGVYAVARGARVLEKHFTLDKAAQCATERAHLGAMDLDELRRLRAMADDVCLMQGPDRWT